MPNQHTALCVQTLIVFRDTRLVLANDLKKEQQKKKKPRHSVSN